MSRLLSVELLLHVGDPGFHVMVVEYLRVPEYVLLVLGLREKTWPGRDSHHDLPCINGQVSIVEAPVKLLIRHGLVRGVVVGSQVVVGEGFGGRYPLLRIKDKHALEEIDGYLMSVLVHITDPDRKLRMTYLNRRRS